jgi:exosortase K
MYLYDLIRRGGCGNAAAGVVAHEPFIRNAQQLLAAACALGLAIALKAFYSRAGATELLWILAPSAWLARLVGGIDLAYEPGAGFISHTYRLVVGPPCAGINFLIIAFLCLYFSFARRFLGRARWLMYSLLFSYGATVAANGFRIFVSAHLWTADIYGQWLTRELAHRLAGAGIYYASLLLLYFAVESGIGRPGSKLAPLFWYLAVSIGAPLGGRLLVEGSPGFAAHAAWVLATALLLTGVKFLPSLLRNRIHLRP